MLTEIISIFNKDDLRALNEVAVASRNEAPVALDRLLSRDGWQNLLLIARESAGERNDCKALMPYA
jgi:hypothetical protein